MSRIDIAPTAPPKPDPNNYGHDVSGFLPGEEARYRADLDHYERCMVLYEQDRARHEEYLAAEEARMCALATACTPGTEVE